MENYVDFSKAFQKLIEKHEKDEDYELIKDYPKIFLLVCKISSDRNADGITKMLMNSALSYFVLPEDVISEKDHGIKGYLDDFFISIHALSELLKYDENLGEYLIGHHWNLEEEYQSYISKKNYELMEKISYNLRSDIISSSGIKFVEELIFASKNPKKHSELKIKDLQKKIFYLFHLFLKNPITGKEEKREFERAVFGTEEFGKFSIILDLLSKENKEFKKSKEAKDEIIDLEEKIKRKRVKRILEE